MCLTMIDRMCPLVDLLNLRSVTEVIRLQFIASGQRGDALGPVLTIESFAQSDTKAAAHCCRLPSMRFVKQNKAAVRQSASAIAT